MTKSQLTGVVIQSTGSWYQVRNDQQQLVKCRIKGKLRLDGIRTTNPVAVGDRVRYELQQDGGGVIKSIAERRNYLIRKAVNLSKHGQIIAANIDHAYLVITLTEPATSFGFIDRFLVTAEANAIPATLIANKTDLYTDHEQRLLQDYSATYSLAGYALIAMSALHQDDIESLRQRLLNKTNLLAGHSGAGKSTMINSLEPGLDLKTDDVSEFHYKGKHTTTFAEMFPLTSDTTNGGYIVDTPGIKGLGVIDIDKNQLSHYFPELRARMDECRFSNCLHINEPDCAVKGAVADGAIAESRYQSYLSIYQTDELDKYR